MKWSIRESVDVYFKALSTFKLGARMIRKDEPILIFDSVKTSTLEVTSEMSYVTGGRGNSRLLSFEGDKVMSFNFEDALLSAEGLAILAGADLLPARNKNLPGASPDAKSVISHFTETYSVETANIADNDDTNRYDEDDSIGGPPRGGHDNIWLSRKPYVGQNASIHVILQDHAGEMSGAPISINLKNTAEKDKTGTGITDHYSYLRKFQVGNKFIPFDANGLPIPKEEYTPPENNWGATTDKNTLSETEAIFDDQVAHYVSYDENEEIYWPQSWGEITEYVQTISDGSVPIAGTEYYVPTQFCYLIDDPKAFKEGTKIVYKVNCPSILYQDIVLIDYYVEYQHDATQISILPDKFAPYVYVEGSSLVRRASDGKDLPCEFVIPKLKITTALTFTLTSSGDASTFSFTGDAYPAFSKFDLTRKVLADIQILDADDNYDSGEGEDDGHPTSYRRFRYNIDGDGEYIWKDPSIEAHSNIDVSDAPNYDSESGGPATQTPGKGIIDTYSGYIEIRNGHSDSDFAEVRDTTKEINVQYNGEVKVITSKGVEILPVSSSSKELFSDLPATLFEKVSLIRLVGEVTSIEIKNINGIADIRSSKNNTELQVLKIINCEDVTNIDLNSFSYLTELNINGIHAQSRQLARTLSKISLPSYENLELLTISNTDLTSIRGSRLPSIKKIDFQNNSQLAELVFMSGGLGSDLKEVGIGSTALIETDIESRLDSLVKALPYRTELDPGTLYVNDEAAATAIKETSLYDDLQGKWWQLNPSGLSPFTLKITVLWNDSIRTELPKDIKMGVRGDPAYPQDGIVLSIDGYEEDYILDKYEWDQTESMAEFTLEDAFGGFFGPDGSAENFTLRIYGRLTKLMAKSLPISEIVDLDTEEGTLADQQLMLYLDLSDTALTKFDAGPWMNSLTDLRVTNNEKLTEIELD